MEVVLAVGFVAAIAATVGGVGLLVGRWLAPRIDRWTVGGEENQQPEELDDDQG